MTDARFKRVDPRAGWTGGKRLDACRECGGEIPKRARTFCSQACVDAWKIRSQPSFAARLVLERDKGVCVDCGLDCVATLASLRELLLADRKARGEQYAGYAWVHDHEINGTTPFGTRIRDLGLKGARARLSRRLWEMDHVVPVVEGGGSCGLDNLRTLCWRCHASATKALAARRAKARTA